MVESLLADKESSADCPGGYVSDEYDIDRDTEAHGETRRTSPTLEDPTERKDTNASVESP